MWLENLKDLKKKANMSTEEIAEAAKLPEKTVSRIFSGQTDNPYVDTLHRIVAVLGGSLDGVLADTKSVVGSADLVTLQGDVDRLNAALTLSTAENAALKSKVDALTAELDMLRMKLAHKEEIIALHNYYNKLLNSKEV